MFVLILLTEGNAVHYLQGDLAAINKGIQDMMADGELDEGWESFEDGYQLLEMVGGQLQSTDAAVMRVVPQFYPH